MKNYKMWIGGKKVDAVSGKTFKVFNPATAEEIAQVPLGGLTDVNNAVEAARKAFPIWSKMSINERAKLLSRVAALIREHAQEFADIDVLDHGSPVRAAKGIVEEACQRIDFAAQTSRNIFGDVIPCSVKPDTLFYLRREPIGVGALIIPWNGPLIMAAMKMAGALAMGNTCVIKPASVDSLSVLHLIDILEKVDFPAGTVNIVTGPGGSVGDALASRAGIDFVSFTGSTDAGKAIFAAASKTVKKLCLELGGKNPFIVLEDADPEKAAKKGASCMIRNSGQICASPGRFYVQEKIYDKFVDTFVAEAKKVVVGDPNQPATEMGPVVSAEHRDRVEHYINTGIEEGASLLLGGKRPNNPPLDKGYFVMPTVFGNVAQNMTIAREEIFGPVGCILKFSTEEEVLRLANDTVYGLGASVWTADLAKDLRFANEIRAGAVWINDHMINSAELPWGGIKESGIGKENSMIGLEEYTQVKLIALDYQLSK